METATRSNETGSPRREAGETPTDSLRALTTSLGLVYAAHDFVIDADTGQWVYLETNANGQWAWLSCVADDIASALAEELNGDHT